MSFCLDTYLQQSDDYEILLSRAGFKDCAKIIKEKAEEIVYINAGEKILGVRIIGIPPIPVGINPKKGTVIISYTKPCHGTAAIEIPVEEEDIGAIKEVSIDD
ncbi:hypothetical protein MBCUT_04320 [Methanobrevibacter cuticularis]|uniref:DUF1894 domain-containing protein n=1 Tax=Methanobrevibacter cuticularis TaxID=47311 RepID=A0A166EUJ5_9EURY|nr:DUF1894 domain-containing protein [Methanobrevibacter cuticularis]KZX17026.1 hypothetical protein MBCUT_04320 [Methanobrevibacter cuticularis]